MYSVRALRSSPNAPGPRQTGGGSSREEEGFGTPTGSVQLRLWSEMDTQLPSWRFSSVVEQVLPDGSRPSFEMELEPG